MKLKVTIFVLALLLLLFSLTVLLYFGAIPLNASQLPGYYGEIIIPSISLETHCVQPTLSSNTQWNSFLVQTIVNQQNIAALMPISTGVNGSYLWTIADHNYQGFERLSDLEIDSSAFFRATDGVIYEYTVTANFIGHNTKSNLTDDCGQSVFGMNRNGIILYTCLDSAQNVRIVFLQPKDSLSVLP